MRTTPENQKLFDLIADARNGKLVLPQFQRNFVWSRDDITALLESVLEGHFIGSFLLLSTDEDDIPFAFRPLQGININPNYLRPEIMVLDGQQRLTSLHYAFAAPEIPLRWTKHPYRFFIDLNKIIDHGILDKAILSERLSDCDGMLTREYQFSKLVIPLTEVENWNDWLNSYEQWLVEHDKDYYFNHYFKIHKPAWNALLERIRNFQVPTITIPKMKVGDQEALAEVCAIFEKINSTGVKLSVYDLLTARLYKDQIDLHRLWEETVDTYHLLDEYSEGNPDEFGVYVLRTIALMRGLEIKSKTLINLFPNDFEKDWRTAVKYMEKALERMTSIGEDGFGVFDRKWMPYVTMVSPLAAMLYAIETKKLGHRAYHLMRRWYWSSVFRERYAGAVESTIQRDSTDLIKAIEDDTYEMDAIHDAKINILDNRAFSLREVSRLNSLYRGVMCLVALRGAKDFSADDSIQFHTLEDHHIFPDAFLKKQKPADGKRYHSEQRNCVINRTLIADQTNRKISKSSPGDYLRKIVPSARTREIMATHYIDDEAVSSMKDNDYEAFLNARENLLIAEIHKRIGERKD
jgi:hypothetical protein